MIMIGVACNDALIAVMARTMKHIHFSVIMFWFSFIGVILMSTALAFISVLSNDATGIFNYEWPQYYPLILTGIFSASNLTCLTIAYQSDNSSTVSLLSYISLVYAFMADVLIFHHHFQPLEIAGALIITTFNLASIFVKRQKQEDPEPNQTTDDILLRNEEDEAMVSLLHGDHRHTEDQALHI